MTSSLLLLCISATFYISHSLLNMGRKPPWISPPIHDLYQQVPTVYLWVCRAFRVAGVQADLWSGATWAQSPSKPSPGVKTQALCSDGHGSNRAPFRWRDSFAPPEGGMNWPTPGPEKQTSSFPHHLLPGGPWPPSLANLLSSPRAWARPPRGL